MRSDLRLDLGAELRVRLPPVELLFCGVLDLPRCFHALLELALTAKTSLEHRKFPVCLERLTRPGDTCPGMLERLGCRHDLRPRAHPSGHLVPIVEPYRGLYRRLGLAKKAPLLRRRRQLEQPRISQRLVEGHSPIRPIRPACGAPW